MLVTCTENSLVNLWVSRPLVNCLCQLSQVLGGSSFDGFLEEGVWNDISLLGYVFPSFQGSRLEGSIHCGLVKILCMVLKLLTGTLMLRTPLKRTLHANT